MTEFELVQTFNYAVEQAWSNLQWWASISVGLIALASIATRKLTLAMVVGISILYAIFTAYSVVNVGLMASDIAGGALGELSKLGEADALSEVGLNLIDWIQRRERLTFVLLLTCFSGFFIGTLAHLWWSYRGGSKVRDQKPEHDG
jgi:hypothetical protein